MYGCSFNDLTDLWPSGSESEEEIVIREIPDESLIDLKEPQDSNIDNVTLEKYRKTKKLHINLQLYLTRYIICIHEMSSCIVLMGSYRLFLYFLLEFRD